MSSTVAPCCAASDPGRPHVRASAARCAQVRSYKYTSPDDTLLESLILNRFWAFAVRAFVPEWIAPNLLTFVGFLHALAAYALLLAHSPALDGSAPPWVYVACAACLFVYQTMDGMDGKQARRIGAGGPLGEVVDHGADAIASCVYGVFLVDVFGIGWEFAYAPSLGRWPAVCLITYSRAAFALDSVASAFTGRLPVARLDAQELQAVIQLTCLWNAAHGVGFWHRLVAFGALGVNDPMPLGVMVVLLGAGAEQHHHDAQGHGVVYAERAERHESVPEPDAVRGVPQARQLDDRLQLLRVEARDGQAARERGGDGVERERGAAVGDQTHRGPPPEARRVRELPPDAEDVHQENAVDAGRDGVRAVVHDLAQRAPRADATRLLPVHPVHRLVHE